MSAALVDAILAGRFRYTYPPEERGDVGVVVHVYGGGAGYEVELANFDGETNAPPRAPIRR